MTRAALLLTVLLVPFAAWTQVPSEKQEIALFSLSSGDPSINVGVMEGVDARIREVFVNLGRFTVTGLDFRLDAIDLDTFIAKLRDLKSQAAQDRQIQFGEKFLTAEEYNRLTGSFFVVIPRVTNYFVADQGNNQLQANIEVSFTILKASDMTPIDEGVINLTAQGTDRNPRKATQLALDTLIPELTYSLRKIDLFQIRSGIIDVKDGNAYIELGTNRGIQLGDEYVIQDFSKVGAFERDQETGLLVIKEVQEKFAIADVAYGKPFVGASVQEVPRFGTDVETYADYVVRATSYGNASNLVLGAKAAVTRGFFDVRPIVGLEIPVILNWSNFFWIPFTVYAGGEFDALRWGRLQATTSIAVSGSGMYIPFDTEPILGEAAQPYYWTHIGMRGDAKLMYLVNRDMKITAHVGVGVTLGVLDQVFMDSNSFFDSSFNVWGGLAAVFKL